MQHSLPVSTPILLLVLASLNTIGPLSIDMYLPSLPTITTDLATSVAKTQLTLSSFFIGMVIGQLIIGPLSDAIGRRPIILTAISAYIVISLLCATVTSIEQLTLLRLLQAVAGGAGIVCGRAVIRDCFSGEDVAKALSIVLMVMAVAPLLAPIIGSYLFQWFGWRSIFIALALFGIAIVTYVAFYLPESLAVENRTPVKIGTILANYRKLLRHREVMGYMLAAGAIFGALFTFISASSFVYIDVFGFTPQQYSWLFALCVIASLLGTILNRLLLQWVESARLFVWGTRLAVLFSCIALLLTWGNWFGVYGTVVAVMVFFSTIIFIASNALSNALNLFPKMAGTTSALFGILQFTFGATFGALAGVSYSNSAMSMIAYMAACALIAWLSQHILHNQKVSIT